MITDKTELDDYKAALRRRRLSEEEFELSSVEDPLPAREVWSETGSVTVRSKKTGAERTYKAGHGKTWVVKFEKDLDVGRFS